MRLVSEDMLHVGNKIYLFASNMNMLYSIDINTGCYELLGMIPGKKMLENRLVASIVEWERQLFLLPLSPGDIWVFSLDNHTWKQIRVDFNSNKLPKTFFKNAIIYNDNMYIFGGYYPAVVILSLKTMSLKYDYAPFEDRIIKLDELYFRGAPVQVDDSLYVASAFDNSILKYSMSTGDFVWIEIGDKCNKYAGIEWDGSSFWLAPRTSKINVIKMTGDAIEEYKLPTDEKKSESLFIGMCRNGNIYVIPAAGGDYGTVSVGFNGTVETTEDLYSVYKRQGNSVLAQYKNGDALFFNDNMGQRAYDGDIPDDLFSNMLANCVPKGAIKGEMFKENAPLLFKDWLSLI